MNCKEFKIWLNTASENELLSLNDNQQMHIYSCNDCNRQINVLREVISFMNQQKNISISNKLSNSIIESLIQNTSANIPKRNYRILFLNRYAAAAVIIIGLLAGAIAGTIITSQNSNNSNPWSTEFTLLSDNTDQITYVFD